MSNSGGGVGLPIGGLSISSGPGIAAGGGGGLAGTNSGGPIEHPVRSAIRRVRDGGWVQLCDGSPFWPLNPRIEDVRIEPIAYALSRISRFCGHTSGEPYSVAQHSVIVSEMVEAEVRLNACCTLDHGPCTNCTRVAALTGLLHDASEFVLSDILNPVKQVDSFVAYRVAEATLQQVIYSAFNLLGSHCQGAEVLDVVDRRVLSTELRDLMPAGAETGEDAVLPYERTIEPWPWREAERKFLDRFHSLQPR